MEKVFTVSGLDCAGCALELEEILKKTEGVFDASVSFMDGKVRVNVQDDEAFSRVKDAVNGFEECSVVEDKTSDETVLRLENLHCAACALDLEDELKKIKGIKNAKVDFLTQTAVLNAESDDAVRKAIKTANKFEKVRVLNGDEVVSPSEKRLAEFIKIAISAVLFFVGVILFKGSAEGRTQRIISYAFFGVSYLSVGYNVLFSTAKNVVKGRVFDENFLMTVASIGAIVLGEYAEGVAVMLLYNIGEFLQAVAVGSSRRSVKELVKLKSEIAVVLKDGAATTVKPETVEIGDILLIKAGEKVPTDGVLLSENALLDKKSLTGESLPVSVKKGDEILSGVLNCGEAFQMKAIRKVKDSAVQKILDLVENSTAKKAQSEKFITKFAKIYTPVVCICAVLIAFLLPLADMLTGGGTYVANLSERVKVALNFLVISCPCALVISVPLSYFCGIGACAKRGALVKGSTYLDLLSEIGFVAFDKTGTLTTGEFCILKTYPEKGVTEQDLIAFTATLESASSHPIAKAFPSVKAEGKTEEIAGKGLIRKGENPDLVGTNELLREYGIAVPKADSVYTVLYVVRSGEYIGCIEIGDKIKTEAKDAINALKKCGIEKTVMLTGDGKRRAEAVANELEIDETYAELLPDEKLEKAIALKAKGAFAYLGDGINDAPVMAEASCAVSMGKLGSAVAVETSDLVLVSDNLFAFVGALKTARKTRRIVRENILFTIICKLTFLGLGFFGMPLSLAVFADVGVMLLAVLNAMRVRRIQ